MIKPCHQYAKDILSGKITACKWIIKACERFQYDMKTAKARGLIFDEPEAEKAIKFIGRLRQHKGREFIGKPIVLQPWQIFHYANIYGWKWKATGLRRFRHVFLTMARKNGKTQMAAGLGLKMMCADNEGGAEVYSAATKAEQARISWNAARAMVKQDPILAKVITYNIQRIIYDKTFSFFAPLSNEYKTSDGLGPHCAILDETHALLTRDLIEVIESGMAAREQPLMYEITTAGFELLSVAYEDWQYSVDILNGFDKPDGIKDDSYFPMIFTLDDEAEVYQEEMWIKANPNMDVSVKPDFIREQLVKAAGMPRKMRYVKVKNFNLWVNAMESWLDMDDWEKSGVEFTPESLEGRLCYGGLDLSSRRDLSAFVLMFPPDPELEERDWKYLCWCYTQEDGLQLREDEIKAPFGQWVDDGWLTATPGARIDHDFIERDIIEAASKYNIRALGYDRWAALDITKHLEDAGILMVMVAQGGRTLNAPAKEFEARLLGGEISHGNNPILKWCCGNAVVKEDENKNIYPSKKMSRTKIDVLMAALNADAVSRADLPDEELPSMYETVKPAVI